ncbi:uncharacterized protein LOC117326133 [Pecten maximus]|uniref:uncharacterized protein LOC117326133 n=1 Tax=Pecten maximus TaxID=6579 RepID=UPI001458BF76|nr:uncharacterized protein LOC117326133 [Pecten maximus]
MMLHLKHKSGGGDLGERLTTMLQLMILAVGLLAGLVQATPMDDRNATVILSLNISTAEGDTYSVNVESEGNEGNDVVHSTMNGNDSQTVVTDHNLNIRVVIPDSETEDCHFLELAEEEKTEQTLEEEDAESVETGSEVMENANSTDEKACLYGDDEPVMTDEVKTTVESWCGARKIRHLTRKAECQDVPQDGSQQAEDSEETESGTLVRRKRSWFWSRFRCYYVCRRVRRCWYRRSCFLFFCRWRRYCVNTWHCYRQCGRYYY